MSDPPADKPGNQTIDIRDVADWKQGPVETFDQRASLAIARWILGVFAGVYFLSFVMAFSMFWLTEEVSYDKAADLVKFLLQSTLPLVTLVVGYYLGDKAGAERSN
jgi:hypothetical protein